SPFGLKILLALALKGIPFYSVNVPNMPPRRATQPLTGGYRRIPVLQLGADLFCDTALILAELEARFPPARGHRSLLPVNPAGRPDPFLSATTAAWADRALFPLAGALMPLELISSKLAKDRAQMMAPPGAGRPKPPRPAATDSTEPSAPLPTPPPPAPASAARSPPSAAAGAATAEPARRTRARVQTHGLLAALDAALAASPSGWLLGQPLPTLADVHVAAHVWFLDTANPTERARGTVASAHPAVAAWLRRLFAAAAASAAATSAKKFATAAAADQQKQKLHWRGPEPPGLLRLASPLSERAAVAVARTASPAAILAAAAAASTSTSTTQSAAAADLPAAATSPLPRGLRPGMPARIAPDDYGRDPARGRLAFARPPAAAAAAVGGGVPFAVVALAVDVDVGGVTGGAAPFTTIVQFPSAGYVVSHDDRGAGGGGGADSAAPAARL
ncbi:hypothetical protein HK405_012197, partial [Cladochytrium tenue]